MTGLAGLLVFMGIALVSGLATALGFKFKFGPFAQYFPEKYEEDGNLPPEPQEVQKPPPESPLPPKPDPMPTKNEILYQKAYSLIGHDASPSDLAPDSLACAESLNGVYRAAFGEPIGTGPALTSTLGLLKKIHGDPRFVEVQTPKVGTITIAATGTSVKGAPHGHCGIWGKHDVMSNDSNSGLWRSNYTHAAWVEVFNVKLGFPIHYFDLVDN